VVTSSGDSTCNVWDIQKNRPISIFTEHTSDVMSCAVSKTDPNIFASGSCDTTAKVSSFLLPIVSHFKDLLRFGISEQAKAVPPSVITPPISILLHSFLMEMPLEQDQMTTPVMLWIFVLANLWDPLAMTRFFLESPVVWNHAPLNLLLPSYLSHLRSFYLLSCLLFYLFFGMK
jgi:hypothetical protein